MCAPCGASWVRSCNTTAKTAEIYARTSQVDKFAVITARLRLGTWSIVRPHGWRTRKFWPYEFVSHVCWTTVLRSLLYIINLRHSCGGMEPNRNLFFFRYNSTKQPRPRSQSRPGGDDSKLINLEASRINFRCFDRRISICFSRLLDGLIGLPR